MTEAGANAPPVPIRITYVIATLDDAGSERQMVALMTGLDRKRFNPSLLLLTRGGPRLEALLRSREIPYHILGKKRKLSLSVIGDLVRALRRDRPHIVHTWLFTSNAYGRAAALLAGVPRLVASERAEDPWKGPIHKWVDRLLGWKTHVIIANSLSVSTRVRSIVGRHARIEVIRNGLDVRPVDPIPREELDLSAQALVLLFAGRFEPQKNALRLVSAFKKVSEADPRALLCLAGQGPQREEIEALVRRLDLSGRVRFLGYREDLPRLLRMADLLVLPSLWEGLPNVILEAMAAHLPIAASRLPCIQEILSHGKEAVLFDPEREEDMTSAMLFCLRDLASARQRAEKAHGRVSEFSLEKMISQTQDLYSRLLEED